MKRSLVVLSAASIAFSARANAETCSTSTSLYAWGDFWIERTGTSCDVAFKAYKYTCGTSGGYRTRTGPFDLTTALTGGNCTKAPEDYPGFNSAIATVMTKYTPGTGNYECDTAATPTFTDADSDLHGQCIDISDTDPAKWVAVNASEYRCNGLDEDNDGTVDDGYTACPVEHRRLTQSNLFQGDAAASAHLIRGSLHRKEVDATIRGPVGSISFVRNYNSKRTTADADLGTGWNHSFAVYLKELADGRWRVQTPSGEHQFFICSTYGASMGCAADDHRPQGRLWRSSSKFYFAQGDGTIFEFFETVDATRGRGWKTLADGGGRIIASGSFSGGQVTKVETANTAQYFTFTYDSAGGPLNKLRISDGAGGNQDIVDFTVDGSSRLTSVKYTATLGTIDTSSPETLYEYDADANYQLKTVKLEIDNVPNTVNVLDVQYEVTGTPCGSNSLRRVCTIRDANKKLELAWTSGTLTTVKYDVDDIGTDDEAVFKHNYLWVTDRCGTSACTSWTANRVGGMAARQQQYDALGRVTCRREDYGQTTVYDYGSSWFPERIDEHDDTSTSCSPGSGSLYRKTWLTWELNTSTYERRFVSSRTRGAYGSSPTTDCTINPLPTTCSAREMTYVSATDDRPRTITTIGTTRLATDSTQQQTIRHRLYYWGDSECTGSDSYSGLLCKQQTTDSGTTVYAETRLYPSPELG